MRKLKSTLNDSLKLFALPLALVQLLTVSVEASDPRSLNLKPTSTQIHKYARPLGAAMVVFSIIILIAGAYSPGTVHILHESFS